MAPSRSSATKTRREHLARFAAQGTGVPAPAPGRSAAPAVGCTTMPGADRLRVIAGTHEPYPSSSQQCLAFPEDSLGVDGGDYSLRSW